MHVRQRSARNDPQPHAGFLRCSVALLHVALQASCHDVVPCVDTAAGSRDDVIDGQVRSSNAAVLAGVIVSVENIAPGQADLFVWNFDVVPEANYRRQWRVGIDPTAIVLNLLCLALQE